MATRATKPMALLLLLLGSAAAQDSGVTFTYPKGGETITTGTSVEVQLEQSSWSSATLETVCDIQTSSAKILKSQAIPSKGVQTVSVYLSGWSSTVSDGTQCVFRIKSGENAAWFVNSQYWTLKVASSSSSPSTTSASNTPATTSSSGTSGTSPSNSGSNTGSDSGTNSGSNSSPGTNSESGSPASPKSSTSSSSSQTSSPASTGTTGSAANPTQTGTNSGSGSGSDTGSPTGTQSNASQSNTPESSTANSSSSSTAGMVSVGTAAGIGIGIGLAILLLGAALLFFLWRRKTRAAGLAGGASAAAASSPESGNHPHPHQFNDAKAAVAVSDASTWPNSGSPTVGMVSPVTQAAAVPPQEVMGGSTIEQPRNLVWNSLEGRYVDMPAQAVAGWSEVPGSEKGGQVELPGGRVR